MESRLRLADTHAGCVLSLLRSWLCPKARSATVAPSPRTIAGRSTPRLCRYLRLKRFRHGESATSSEPERTQRGNALLASHATPLSGRRDRFSRARYSNSSDAGLVPTPLPFTGVKFYPRESMRYQSRIDPAALLQSAKEELFSPTPRRSRRLFSPWRGLAAWRD